MKKNILWLKFKDTASALISVTDHGVGIPKEEHEKDL